MNNEDTLNRIKAIKSNIIDAVEGLKWMLDTVEDTNAQDELRDALFNFRNICRVLHVDIEFGDELKIPPESAAKIDPAAKGLMRNQAQLKELAGAYVDAVVTADLTGITADKRKAGEVRGVLVARIIELLG